MTDPIADIARASATRLVPAHGPSLPIDVEAALHGRSPDRYSDPIALGSLIVSIATLAWTVYTDLKKNGAKPSSEVITRTVRVRLRDSGPITPDQERIIEAVISETLER